MSKIGFDECFKRIIGHEGEFSDDYNDRGNWTTGTIGEGELKGTKYGVSAMSYPHLDIANLSLEEAKAIYYEDFWKKVNAEEFHAAVAFQLFDASVNHGTGNAVRFLQRGLGVADDGDVGRITLNRYRTTDVDDLLHKFNAERLIFYTKLSNFGLYGSGWVRRVAQNMKYSAYDYTAPWYTHVETE